MEVKVAQNSQNPRHLDVYVQEELVKIIDKTLYKRCLRDIRKMKNLEEEFKVLEQRVSLNYTLFLLGRRAYSTFEITKKLKEKLISQSSIDLTLSKCTDYISDEDLIASIIRVESGRGKGKRAIMTKLTQRLGKTRDELEGWLETHYPEDSELERAVALSGKKYRKTLSFEEKGKAIRFLVGRGFSYPIAKEALFKSQRDLDNEEME